MQGKQVEIFERNIAKYLGVKHAVCVSNATATLHLGLIALGIGNEMKLLYWPFYIASANVIELVGAKPIFVDINLNTFNINTSKISESITKNTKAILTVHEFGLCSDISKLMNICKKNNIYLIEDAACALGAKENNLFAGSIGEFGSFSFHPRKAITSGEGGILTTNNSKLASKIRILRNHGVKRVNNKYDFVNAGYNYRMTDIQVVINFTI